MADRKTYDAKYREQNRERLRDAQTARRRQYKALVFDRYGNACASCGFTDIRALQIDHIHNNGAEERRALGGKQVSGWRFYHHLIKSNYPDGYQTLCANCNMIKQLGDNF